ncbi:hypothetical protein STRMOE7_24375 [Streptomyces sp. MOE7]|nr:hypothetical protein STRMOE7_24375 [Streptomyces sp. MOE7]
MSLLTVLESLSCGFRQMDFRKQFERDSERGFETGLSRTSRGWASGLGGMGFGRVGRPMGGLAAGEALGPACSYGRPHDPEVFGLAPRRDNRPRAPR